jgi:metalloendopeptidase OMA1, mitochondrial
MFESMKTTSLNFAALLLISALSFGALSGCGTVPVTGRTQLLLVSPEQEFQLGLTAFEQLKQEVPVSRDPQANALVQKVGQRIAAVANPDLPDAQWEFVVFESKEPNAFCLPGGKVGVHTGILPITMDEAGLATVIGHEVAHAAARHGAERLSRSIATEVGGQLVGATIARYDPRVQTAAALAYGLGAQLGVALPHSRQQESEADRIGLIYMARAGYNPEAAISFWQRFAEATASEGGAPWFLRTHPVTETRIEDLRSHLPEALAEYRLHKDRISF